MPANIPAAPGQLATRHRLDRNAAIAPNMTARMGMPSASPAGWKRANTWQVATSAIVATQNAGAKPPRESAVRRDAVPSGGPRSKSKPQSQRDVPGGLNNPHSGHLCATCLPQEICLNEFRSSITRPLTNPYKIESGADERHPAARRFGKSPQNLRCKRAQVVDAVAPRNQDDYGNIESGDVLLIRKISIRCEKHVELGGSKASSSPFRLLAHPISGTVLASWPMSSRFKRLGRHSSSRTRTGEERLLGLL
jgi:hypothetical protein